MGFITSAPASAACRAWHPDVYATARLQKPHVFASSLWILSGVCYGFASGPTSRTHQLLEHLSDRVVDAATGPRVIAGDFNLLEPDNPFEPHCATVDLSKSSSLGHGPQARCLWPPVSSALARTSSMSLLSLFLSCVRSRFSTTGLLSMRF